MRSQPASARARGRRVLLGIVLAVAGLVRISFAEGSARAPRSAAPKPPPRGWLQGHRVRLTVSPRGGTKTVTYNFAIASGGDMRIGIEEREGQSEISRELLLISGRFLAARGAKLPPGYEIDVLDAAALSWQLAGQLLERAAPGDPVTLRAPVRIALTESRAPITVSTNSGEETFPPPWSAEGRINPIGAGRIDFEFAFSFHSSMPPSEPEENLYSGRWEGAAPAPTIEDGMSLNGWNLYSLGAQRHMEKDGSHMVDFGASPLRPALATVGALRRLARSGRP